MNIFNNQAEFRTVSFPSEERAKQLVSQLKEEKAKLAVLNEEMRSIQENDSELQSAIATVNKHQMVVKERKAKIVSTLEWQQMKNKKSEQRQVVAELEESLSNTLESYTKESGQLMFEGFDGEQFKIVKKFKLAKGWGK